MPRQKVATPESPDCRSRAHSPWLIAGPRLTLSRALVKEESVTRLLIAIVVGALLAVGGSLLTATYLAGNTDSTPANAPLYNYGTG
jgi:hypothetical protein